MNVTSSNAGSQTLATGDDSSSMSGQKTLGQDDFLKLLATQLSAQDPMKPMDDTQFISQMANFSSLQQMQALNQQFTAYASAQQAVAAPEYLNKLVTATDPNTGHSVSGVPSAVNVSGGNVTLTIDGQDFPLANVTRVASIPSGSAPSTASNLSTAAADAVTGALGSN